MHALAQRHQFYFSVSATTRRPRPGETDGVDYYFVDEAGFKHMREQGELLEWAEYSGHLYGTPRAPVLDRLSRGEDVLLDIEIKGAIQVKEAFPAATTLFISPPSVAELERRLRTRGDTSDQDVDNRLGIARWQLEVAEQQFDHIVINDSVEGAVERIVRILEAPSNGS